MAACRSHNCPKQKHVRSWSCPLRLPAPSARGLLTPSLDFCRLQGSHCTQALAQQQPPARGCQRHPAGLAPAAQPRQAPAAHPKAPPGAGHGLHAPAAAAGQVGAASVVLSAPYESRWALDQEAAFMSWSRIAWPGGAASVLLGFAHMSLGGPGGREAAFMSWKRSWLVWQPWRA